MARAYGLDLRRRVVEAIDGGMSARGAAALAASTGSAAYETQGPAEASAGTGYRESGHIKDYYKTTQL